MNRVSVLYCQVGLIRLNWAISLLMGIHISSDEISNSISVFSFIILLISWLFLGSFVRVVVVSDLVLEFWVWVVSVFLFTWIC